MAKLYGQENKNSNFHNFLHGDINNPDELLNQRCLYKKNCMIILHGVVVYVVTTRLDDVGAHIPSKSPRVSLILIFV